MENVLSFLLLYVGWRYLINFFELCWLFVVDMFCEGFDLGLLNGGRLVGSGSILVNIYLFVMMIFGVELIMLWIIIKLSVEFGVLM